MLYEQCEHDGTLLIISVNTFQQESTNERKEIEPAQATEAEKCSGLNGLVDSQVRHAGEAPEALCRLQ
jgi:methylmalonyl-CoA mutase